MSIHDLAAQLAEAGVQHRIVLASEFNEADAAGIHFSTTSERLKQRKEAKLYRQRNKAKLKLKAKKYAKLMKHKKPNLQRSRIAKLVAKHYHHN